MEKSRTEKLFPTWFSICFYISSVILVTGGLIDTLNGSVEGSKAWGAGISIFLMYLIMIFVWKKRDSKIIQKIIGIKIPFHLLSILIGIIFAELDEIVCFPFNSFFPGVTLIGDILLTLPIYVGAHFFWFLVLKKYKFSNFQAFLVGGLSLGLYEIFLGGGPLSILTILLWPFIIMIHGVHMIIPKILLQKYFEKNSQKETRFKYLIGVILPALGVALGMIITFLMTLMGVK